MITSRNCLKKYGEPGNPKTEGRFISIWDVPADIRAALPAIPARIYCNNDLRAPLEKAFRNLISRGLTKELRTWDGCYQVRNKRGLGSLSLHSWAIAIDVNAAWNRLGQKPTVSAAFVKCFTDAGFDWGGNWSRPDGMHFQLSSI
jgi:D-alanyl-D-alanine carboxypeptidase